MSINDYLLAAAFTFPPVFLLVRYLKKDEQHRPKLNEVAGIVICITAMLVFLLYLMYNQIFY